MGIGVWTIRVDEEYLDSCDCKYRIYRHDIVGPICACKSYDKQVNTIPYCNEHHCPLRYSESLGDF